MTFFELEKECKKRKVKFVLFFILLIISVLISGFYIYIYFKNNISEKRAYIHKIKETNNSKKINKYKKIKKEVTQHVLKPIIDLNITDFKRKEISEKKENKKVKPADNKIQTIIKTSTLPSFETCIKLAGQYFKNRDYKNALKWAKNANIQNKKDPQSWIIVAKSLYKMGKKDKAVHILKVYYDYTKNKDILKLIERMKHDKI
jgi:predicted Zn-dependent protease